MARRMKHCAFVSAVVQALYLQLIVLQVKRAVPNTSGSCLHKSSAGSWDCPIWSQKTKSTTQRLPSPKARTFYSGGRAPRMEKFQLVWRRLKPTGGSNPKLLSKPQQIANMDFCPGPSGVWALQYRERATSLYTCPRKLISARGEIRMPFKIDMFREMFSETTSSEAVG